MSAPQRIGLVPRAHREDDLRMRPFVVLVLATSVAAADPEPEPQPYRGFIMMSDAFSALFTFGGAALTYRNRNCDCEDFSAELIPFGAATYVSFSAFVHHEAGHNSRAFASVMLRLSLPFAAGLAAHFAGASDNASVLAAGGGMVGAMVLDWYGLADSTYVPAPKTTVYVTPLPGGGAIAGLTWH